MGKDPARMGGRVRIARRLTLGIAGLVAYGAIVGSAEQAPALNRASAVSPAGDIERGRQLAMSCAACHTADAPTLGEPAFHAPKLRYQRPSTIFYALQDYKAGKRKSDFMEPIAQAFSEQDMRDLAVFLSARTLRSRIPPRKGPILDTPAHRLNSQRCGMCHGETGLGEVDGYPVLGGQYPDYIEHALAEYRSGQRSNPIMQRFARSLTPQETEMMAGYFADQVALEPVQ